MTNRLLFLCSCQFFDRPKDAVRAIKRRLQQNAGKNHTVIMYTLTVSMHLRSVWKKSDYLNDFRPISNVCLFWFMFVCVQILETCVKNCGRRFHLLVTNKDFIQDLVKLIGPKNDPPAELQEKV